MVSIRKVYHQSLLTGLYALSCGLGGSKKKKGPNGLIPKMSTFPPYQQPCFLYAMMGHVNMARQGVRFCH